jgi:ABC-type phosphate transport system substrate-binding protein
MRMLQALLIVAVLLLPYRLGVAHADAMPPFLIIVHADNPVTTLDRKTLSDTFLKKKTRWPGGDVIHPVDQIAAADVRTRFSAKVLERTVSAVRAYWQQRIFSGRDVPPPELVSDEEVVKYVLGRTGAVGYVSASADIKGARPLRIE